MKIAFLVYDFHFGGGGERVTSNLANEFCLKGYDVTIIPLCKKNDRKLPFKVHEKIKIKYLNTDVFSFSIFNKFVSLFVLRKFLKKNNYNIVLGIGTYLNILLALSVKKNAESKTIGCEHNYFFSVSFFWKLLRRWTYPSLSAIVSLTEEDLKHLSKLNKVSVVIPNACSFTTEKVATLEANKIITLGRFFYQKGYDLMLDMFSDFCKLNKEFNLEIYGEGPEKNKIKRLIDKYKLNNRVSIFPMTKEVETVYLRSSIYLMTSRFEGLPMVLIEASECGLPLIAYDCKTGPAEIIKDEENGFLIPFGEKSQMVDKLNIICNDIKLRKVMGRKSKEMAFRFNKKEITKRWINLFNKIL